MGLAAADAAEQEWTRSQAEAGLAPREINDKELMVYTALRALAGIFAGLFVAFVLLVAVELFSGVVHPFPEDFEGTPEAMCRHVERYPPWVLALVVPAWAATAFAGSWTAKRLGNLGSFAVVGLVLLAALLCNISMLPYPLWFKIANLLVIPAAVLAAGRSSRRRGTAGVDEPSATPGGTPLA